MNVKGSLCPAVFFDKDGTLIEDRPYNVDCAKIHVADGAFQAAKMLHDAGFMLVVVTNQSGIAKGIFSLQDLHRVEDYLKAIFATKEIPLAGFYFCPHLPDGRVEKFAVHCDCRKPQPGLLFQAAKDLQIDLERSWFVGDILDDVEAGHRAGCRTVLVNNGTETVWNMSPLRRPEAIAADLRTAADYILEKTSNLAPNDAANATSYLDDSDHAKIETAAE